MGCDIHLYLEYKEAPEKDYWQPFGGRLSERNYTMFGLMAGVRGGPALVEPKGLPGDVAYRAESDYTLIPDDNFKDSEGFCGKAEAQRWVAQGCSKPWKYTNRITGPDWHSPSWLGTDEFEKVISAYHDAGYPETYYHAILAAMKSFPVARIVFWFDN